MSHPREASIIEGIYDEASPASGRLQWVGRMSARRFFSRKPLEGSNSRSLLACFRSCLPVDLRC